MFKLSTKSKKKNNNIRVYNRSSAPTFVCARALKNITLNSLAYYRIFSLQDPCFSSLYLHEADLIE